MFEAMRLSLEKGKSSKLRAIIIATMMVTVFIFSCSSPGTKALISLEDIELTDLEGKSVKLSSVKGKVIFINFWATWCRPCLAEMPAIMRLRDQLKDQDIVFYFASDEESDRIQSFIDKRNMEGTFVRIENPEAIGIQALPTTFIFDKKGTLVYSEVGYKNWEEASAIELITTYLNE